MTYDGTTLRLLCERPQVSSVAQTGVITTSTNPLQIGGDITYGQFFQGTIDEVRVYNTAPHLCSNPNGHEHAHRSGHPSSHRAH